MSPEFEAFELAARIRRMSDANLRAVIDAAVNHRNREADHMDIADCFRAWAESLRPADIKKDAA